MKLINNATGEITEIIDSNLKTEIIDSNLKIEVIHFKLGHERYFGKGWDEIKIHETVRIIAKDIDTLVEYANGKAKKLANYHECEVRWNYDWSNQGHYFRPEGK